jgi:hypothetical protein
MKAIKGTHAHQSITTQDHASLLELVLPHLISMPIINLLICCITMMIRYNKQSSTLVHKWSYTMA